MCIPRASPVGLVFSYLFCHLIFLILVCLSPSDSQSSVSSTLHDSRAIFTQPLYSTISPGQDRPRLIRTEKDLHIPREGHFPPENCSVCEEDLPPVKLSRGGGAFVRSGSNAGGISIYPMQVRESAISTRNTTFRPCTRIVRRKKTLMRTKMNMPFTLRDRFSVLRIILESLFLPSLIESLVVHLCFVQGVVVRGMSLSWYI